MSLFVTVLKVTRFVIGLNQFKFQPIRSKYLPHKYYDDVEEEIKLFHLTNHLIDTKTARFKGCTQGFEVDVLLLINLDLVDQQFELYLHI